MRSSAALFAGIAATVMAQDAIKPEADGRYTLSAPGIKAQFIPYGASLTNLWVKDKNGADIDVVLGYDDAAFYPKDPGHPVLNSIPGRYVGRIGNAKFTIDGKTYETEKNDGNNTLHSGTNNWSFRVWNVTSATNTSITFSIEDPAESSKGMPGTVKASVTYTLSEKKWDIKMTGTADAKTPLMLTQHTYFNLDAYKNPATNQIFDHTLYMPYSQRYLENDDGALPTGKILTATPGSINDFASAANMTVGHSRNSSAFATNCGPTCEGYNGQWLIDNAPKDAVVLTLSSAYSGVKAELRTDQVGIQIYTCNWSDGTGPLKSTQGTNTTKTVGKSSCIAVEAQDYADGINHPEWNRTEAEITGPGETYTWASSWTFGTI